MNPKLRHRIRLKLERAINPRRYTFLAIVTAEGNGRHLIAFPNSWVCVQSLPKLIAAAPELLEALQEALELLCRDEFVPHRGRPIRAEELRNWAAKEGRIVRLKTIISKATGQ